MTQRPTSASKFTTDLLPAQTGTSHPDSYSVFNQLIVNDDPLDGSRLLRKRKASDEDFDDEQADSKRRRGSASQSRAQSVAPRTTAPAAGAIGQRNDGTPHTALNSTLEGGDQFSARRV